MKIAKVKIAFTCCALLVGATQTAAALPKQGSGGKCDCLCEAPSGAPGGVIHSFATYDSHGLQCDAFTGATCNVQSSVTGGIATGTIKYCDSTANTSRRPATIFLPTGVKISPLLRR